LFQHKNIKNVKSTFFFITILPSLHRSILFFDGTLTFLLRNGALSGLSGLLSDLSALISVLISGLICALFSGLSVLISGLFSGLSDLMTSSSSLGNRNGVIFRLLFEARGILVRVRGEVGDVLRYLDLKRGDFVSDEDKSAESEVFKGFFFS